MTIVAYEVFYASGLNRHMTVLLPTLWRWIDIAGNGCRYPANTKAEKEHQGGLHLLGTSNCLDKQENNRPGDGETCTVDPIVPVPRHFLTSIL